MTFPVEGWDRSAAVDVWQTPDGIVHGDISGSDDTETVRRQAARSLSLDHDGSGWEAIGKRDPVLGALQARYDWLRPVCFYSAYEAATSFVIGQRIAMRQARVVKDRLSAEHGDPIEIGGQVVRPFPRPQRLVDIAEVQGISAVKVARLRDLARAAVDGVLDTERLRALPEDEALSQLRTLPGIGPWTAQAILMRGCGLADSLPLEDDISRTAVATLYGLPEPPDDATWTAMSDAWRPYRMWATVLLHMAWRREQVSTPSYRQSR
jgi:DNA-3-methyladenine glycosylase II